MSKGLQNAPRERTGLDSQMNLMEKPTKGTGRDRTRQ